MEPLGSVVSNVRRAGVVADEIWVGGGDVYEPKVGSIGACEFSGGFDDGLGSIGKIDRRENIFHTDCSLRVLFVETLSGIVVWRFLDLAELCPYLGFFPICGRPTLL